jgi:alpha-L-fucosidase
MKRFLFLTVAILFLGTKTIYSQDFTSNVQKTQWFTDARFGMFIHFGLYSIPAGVWEGRISGRNMYA